jgi:hypothetical protein
MTRLRNIGIWLTAVTTIAAGFPQSVCACPGGPAKPAESSTAQACSCGGGCCGSAASAKCCDGERESTRHVPSPASDQALCKKVLLVQNAQAPPATTSAYPSGDVASWIAVTPSVVQPVPPVAVTATAWQLPSHAPPVDLLILLQHFLI